MAAPFNLEKLSLDLGASSAGSSIGNVTGPTVNYGGKNDWLTSSDSAVSPVGASYLAPGLAVLALAGVIYVALRGRK